MYGGIARKYHLHESDANTTWPLVCLSIVMAPWQYDMDCILRVDSNEARD